MNVCTFYSRYGDSITHKVQSCYISERPDTTCNTFNLLQNHELHAFRKTFIRQFNSRPLSCSIATGIMVTASGWS